MRLSAEIYTETSPDHEHNEDFVLAGSDFVIVLDGASPVPGLENGCIHDVPWLVRQLGLRLAEGLTAPAAWSLAAILEHAIQQVCDAHADTCDLKDPNSPSSTVALLRLHGDRLDYLALADSSVVLRMADGGILPITDDRLDHLQDYSVPGVAAARNTDKGFWVASTKPEAARHAVSGSISLAAQPVQAAAVLTDGAATLVERHDQSWGSLFSILETGPHELVRQTREADETAAGKFRGKRHDDATAVLCHFVGSQP
ncbi:protein phosphatase 2C domain-containing protein [Nocardioides sp.]|uniref:protein phosphatase 2C domain-containing protein n=1 Tax=Nocardioides sp. TaxID=35761 RepID=UPI0019A8DAE2|nr:protein phosphatase 2C domain-containing protein [Nocardioides sp.]MBC7275021.1 protein phosphatase 2C domain-containing protein [Nocardioides sp.]